MAQVTDEVRCNQCGTVVAEPGDLPVHERKPCPNCGSLTRHHAASLASPNLVQGSWGGTVTFFNQAIESVARADPDDVQAIASSQIQLLHAYYQSVLDQAKASFRAALALSIAGVVLLSGAIGFMLADRSQNIAILTAIGGVLIEAISGLNFWLYGRATAQFGSFHERLERTQGFLLANSICASLSEDLRHSTRAELVKLIATLPPTDHK